MTSDNAALSKIKDGFPPAARAIKNQLKYSVKFNQDSRAPPQPNPRVYSKV
jgi:hypothetical protein